MFQTAQQWSKNVPIFFSWSVSGMPQIGGQNQRWIWHHSHLMLTVSNMNSTFPIRLKGSGQGIFDINMIIMPSFSASGFLELLWCTQFEVMTIFINLEFTCCYEIQVIVACPLLLMFGAPFHVGSPNLCIAIWNTINTFIYLKVWQWYAQ